MSIFSKLFGKNKNNSQTKAGGMEDFMLLIRVYYQAVMAAQIGINNLSALPDLRIFKQTYHVATINNKPYDADGQPYAMENATAQFLQRSPSRDDCKAGPSGTYEERLERRRRAPSLRRCPQIPSSAWLFRTVDDGIRTHHCDACKEGAKEK